MNTAGDKEDITTFSACYSMFAGFLCGASVRDRASLDPDVTFTSLPIVETLLGLGYLSYVVFSHFSSKHVAISISPMQ